MMTGLRVRAIGRWAAVLIGLACVSTGRHAFAAENAKPPDIGSVPPDLVTPKMIDAPPAAGKRVRCVAPEYRGTDVHHALYLPTDWRPGGKEKYPVLVEYAGNGPYRNKYGDVSDGTVEGSNLGYGISGGKGFIWLCLPYVNAKGDGNQTKWWGDATATVEYCKKAVPRVCRDFGGDPSAVILIGFSRGAIACNYIGLHDDEIARLWRAFIPYSHYDGVRDWGYAAADRASALKRLERLAGRPQFVCMENSVEETRKYLAAAGVKGDFTFMVTPFRNHNDQWAHRDTPHRRRLREWVRTVLVVTDGGPSEARAGCRPRGGRAGGVLRVLSTADGETLAEYKLAAPPVWNGLAAANGRVFLSGRDGRLVCLGGAK